MKPEKNIPKSFIIPTDRLHDGLEVREELPATVVSEMIAEPDRDIYFQATTPGKVELKFNKHGEYFILDGQAYFEVASPCVKCLENRHFKIDLKFHHHLRPAAELPDAVDSRDYIHVEGDDEDEGGYDAAIPIEGQVINLYDIVREEIFLELPLYPACNEIRVIGEHVCQIDKMMEAAGDYAGIIPGPFSGLMHLKLKDPKEVQ